MKTDRFSINGIPAVLLGEKSDRVFLFLHGKCGCKEEAVPFAEIAAPKGYQILGIDLPEHGERKKEKNAFVPWVIVPELKGVLAFLQARWKTVALRANSISCYFSMRAFEGEPMEKALFVSPICDMKLLIADMMNWAGITGEQLREKGEIRTAFGETLSWRYLTDVQEHPVRIWRVPTFVLYADGDNLTARGTVDRFVSEHSATLTVMENGEHWFHTEEQLAVLNRWTERWV